MYMFYKRVEPLTVGLTLVHMTRRSCSSRILNIAFLHPHWQSQAFQSAVNCYFLASLPFCLKSSTKQRTVASRQRRLRSLGKRDPGFPFFTKNHLILRRVHLPSLTMDRIHKRVPDAGLTSIEGIDRWDFKAGKAVAAVSGVFWSRGGKLGGVESRGVTS